MDFRKFDRARRSATAIELDHIESYASGRISRRDFVRRGTVIGLTVPFMAAVISACGDDKGGSSTTLAPGTTGAPGTTASPATTGAPTTTAAAGGIKQGGTLRIASQKPGGPLDPVAMYSLGAYTQVATCFEYLCGQGEGALLAPALATKWTPTEGGKVWTFELRKGVTWHDGSPFTAADVVATLDRLAGSNLKAQLAPGASVAKDDFTVEVTLNAADGGFPYNLSWSNAQSVITPKDYVAGTTLDTRAVGTGPFKLDKIDVATGATFSRNDKWWGGTTYLDKLEYLFSDDIATQITGLQGGAADAIVQFSVAGGDALLNDSKINVIELEGAAHREMWMNTREGTFVDKTVRQAVALGLDRDALIANVLKGKGDIGNDHPIAPVFEFWDSTQPQRTRDVEKAKGLLQAAGKAGLKVTLYAPKLQEIPEMAQLIQSQLKDIGMDITLNVESTDTFYNEWCKTYDPICDGGQEFGIVDYGNRGVPDVYLTKSYATGEWNSAHYVSTPFQDAVKEYQASVDTSARAAAAKKIQTIANEDVPYAIPYFYNELSASTSEVSGVRITGLGHFDCSKAGFKA